MATITTKQKPLLIHTAAAEELRGAGLTVVAAGDERWSITWPNGEQASVDGEGLLEAARLLDRQGQITPDQLMAAIQPDTTATIAPIRLPLTLLDDNPYQPRLDYDPERITAIAESIARHGLLQAPIGRRMPDGRVQLAFGHSRRRAFDQLAVSNPDYYGAMPVLLRVLDDEMMALHAWVENRDRKDLSAYEEARAIQRYTTEFGWSQKAAAAKMQLDASTVSNKLRLLRLPEATLAQLQAGQLSERQALALLPLMDLPEATRAQRVNVWMSGGPTAESADALLAGAGKHDSATIRTLVERLLAEVSKSLAKVAWSKEAFALESGMQSATCTDCPLRIKASDRCMDNACYTLKLRAHQARAAAAAAASVGLPAVGDLPYHEYSVPSGVTLDTLQAKAREKQCGHLAVRTGGYSGLAIPGYSNCYAICAHGAGKRCGCMQSLARSNDPAASADALKRHNRAKIDAELIGPGVAQLQEALTRPTVGMWRLWLARVDGAAERKLPKDARVTDVQAALAKALVGEVTYWDHQNGQVASVQHKLSDLLAACGAPAPWDLRANIAEVAPVDIGPTPSDLPTTLIARAVALGITIGPDLALHWRPSGEHMPIADVADLKDALDAQALDLTALLISTGRHQVPGVTFQAPPGATIASDDYAAGLSVIAAIAEAEESTRAHGSPPRWMFTVGAELEGCADIFDDASYANLATRLSAMERPQEAEVAA